MFDERPSNLVGTMGMEEDRVPIPLHRHDGKACFSLGGECLIGGYPGMKIEGCTGDEEFPKPAWIGQVGIQQTKLICPAPYEKPIGPLKKHGPYHVIMVEGKGYHRQQENPNDAA